MGQSQNEGSAPAHLHCMDKAKAQCSESTTKYVFLTHPARDGFVLRCPWALCPALRMEGQKGHSLLSCSAGLGPGWVLVWFVLSPKQALSLPVPPSLPSSPAQLRGSALLQDNPHMLLMPQDRGWAHGVGPALAAAQRLLWLQMCSSKSFWQLEMPQELSRRGRAGFLRGVAHNTQSRAQHPQSQICRFVTPLLQPGAFGTISSQLFTGCLTPANKTLMPCSTKVTINYF